MQAIDAHRSIPLSGGVHQRPLPRQARAHQQLALAAQHEGDHHARHDEDYEADHQHGHHDAEEAVVAVRAVVFRRRRAACRRRVTRRRRCMVEAES